MARAHEEVRLREPANRASQVRTVYGKDLERLIVNVPDPASDVVGLSVPRIDDWISISGETSLARRELFQAAEREPGLVSELLFASHRRKQVTYDRHRQQSADDTVKKQAELHERRSSRDSVFWTHRGPPFVRSMKEIGYGWPGSCGRWLESHATTSEMSWADMGRPSTSPRQSGAPNSGRPAITIVRSCPSLTKARYEPFTIELALFPPRPFSP